MDKEKVKKLLTFKDFYEEVIKKYSNKKELVNYLNQITKNYTIPVDNDDDKTQYPDEYPESYIVNESKIRFKNEIKQSHFLSHWKDLCKYTEVTSKLRFIYNLINIKKDPLISLLSSITHKIISSNVILENNVTSNSAYSQYFQKIINFLGLSQNDISRIKIDNQSFKTFKSSQNKRMRLSSQSIELTVLIDEDDNRDKALARRQQTPASP